MPRKLDFSYIKRKAKIQGELSMWQGPQQRAIIESMIRYVSPLALGEVYAGGSRGERGILLNENNLKGVLGKRLPWNKACKTENSDHER